MPAVLTERAVFILASRPMLSPIRRRRSRELMLLAAGFAGRLDLLLVGEGGQASVL